MDYLSVAVDMAGCPNRCRHCWLDGHKNGNMTVDEFRDIAGQFKNWRDEDGNGIRELSFFSWWREPDFRDDYRELWRLEGELSSPGQAKRFELLSIWRLARDESYAKWAAELEPKVCQISFFGMEGNTDWGTRRSGAFRDNLLATERLIEAGIAPRWQLFVTKHCLDDLDGFLRLIYELDLHKRCEAIGQKFEVFIGGISPEGNGYELESVRIEASDIALIPDGLIDICREGIDLLGQPEHVLLDSLLRDDSTSNLDANFPSVSINAGYDVYPNIAEPVEWWRLGNLKTDGVDAIIKAYRDKATPGMKMNRETPVSELARRYGEKDSKKLY
ncbi:MAG: radical SAM protein, partial [Oscillospiraceae bacterium]|nr:radical SAM protein [Oscillospiraceae bacterium]